MYDRIAGSVQLDWYSWIGTAAVCQSEGCVSKDYIIMAVGCKCSKGSLALVVSVVRVLWHWLCDRQEEGLPYRMCVDIGLIGMNTEILSQG